MNEAVEARAQGEQAAGRRPGEAPEGTVFLSRTKSFTRRTRELPSNLARTWEAHAHRYVVEPRRGVGYTTVAQDFTLDLAELFGRSAPVTLEIGSGTGEQIVAAAAAHPERNFLALEVWVPGIAKLISKAVEADVDNIRVIEADAAQALPIMLGTRPSTRSGPSSRTRGARPGTASVAWSPTTSRSRSDVSCAMAACGVWPLTGMTMPGRCATSLRPANYLRTRMRVSVRTRRIRSRSVADLRRVSKAESSRTLRREASMRAATLMTSSVFAALVVDGHS